MDTKRAASKVTMEDLVRRALGESLEGAGAYFRRQWLTRITRTLTKVRGDAGLTQAQVAAKMGTTQSAIARLENDLDGSISLHRYVDFLLACGAMPLLPEIKSVEALRAAGLEDPRVSPLEPRLPTPPELISQPVMPWSFDESACITLPAGPDLPQFAANVVPDLPTNATGHLWPDAPRVARRVGQALKRGTGSRPRTEQDQSEPGGLSIAA